jgi:hypothetical protein
MTAPYNSSSARSPQGPFKATHHQDFLAHTSGGGFRHTADQVDMNPVLPGFSATTVQSTLLQMQGAISAAGTGFLSIGQNDGYAGTLGSYDVGSVATPTLAQTFAAAVADHRLLNGGIILLLAGTYHTSSQITIPQGITVMGEVAGTYIIGNMSEQSIFKIAPSTINLLIGSNSGGSDVHPITGTNVGKSGLFNLILIDNNDGYGGAGVDSTMTTVPMVSVQNGASVEFERVTFLGRLNTGVALDRVKTKAAIGTIAGSGTGTTIAVKGCYIDGVKVAITFTSNLGNEDFLTVSGTRARWYGKEAAAYSATDDAFVVGTVSNIKISDCYLVGAGSKAKTLLTLQTSGAPTTTSKISITGVSGSAAIQPGLLIDNQSSSTSISTVLTGNNWSSCVDSTWYLVVGGAGNYPAGDLFGSGAIDTVLGMTAFEGTVIVNPGTYIVTGTASTTTNWTNVKFIGNKFGNQYPIFQMQLSAAGNDDNGNKPLVVGNHIEGIYFKGGNAVNSIRPSFNALSVTTQNYSQTLTVKDCVFNDVCLSPLPLAGGVATDQLGFATKTIMNIEDCYFNQTGTYADNIGFSSAITDSLNITDCHFAGKGYAITIVGSGSLRSSVNLNRVFCDFTGTTITTNNPRSSNFNGHVWIQFQTQSGTINIKNSQILASSALDCVSTLIGGSFLYPQFCYLTASFINISESVFNGPNQLYTSAAVDYPIVTVSVAPYNSCRIANNTFIGGGLPLYVGGNFSSQYRKENIVIDANNFIGGSTSTASISQTLLDIDINCTAVNTTTLMVTNNVFNSNNASNPLQPAHTFVTGATYNTNAIAQIYCRGMNALVSGNHVRGTIRTPTINPFNRFAGIYVNTYTSGSGATTLVTTATVENNNISIGNSFQPSASQTVDCLNVFSTVINVSGNNLNLINNVATTGHVGSLYADARLVGTSGTILVRGNVFGRATDAGALQSLSLGYCYFPVASNTGGIITDNSFDSPTIDGADTAILNIFDTTKNWVYTRNKNQTVSAIIYPTVGQIGIYVAGTDPIVAGAEASVTASNVTARTSLKFNYIDDNITQIVNWFIPLTVIPPTASLISASTSVVASVTAGITIESASMFFSNILGTSTPTSVTLTASPQTLSHSVTGYTSDPVYGAYIGIELISLAVTANNILTVGPVTVTYRW